MSGEGPESIPTSADPRSKRPTKRRALTPVSEQARTLDALFARPDQEIRIPTSSIPASQRPRIPPTPDMVTNVQGSSAGAGSGEFHVYKASRRREYERLRIMDEERARAEEAEEFERARREREAKDDEKTRKNREKREKARLRKEAKKGNQQQAKADGAGGVKGVTAPAKPGPRVYDKSQEDEVEDNGGASDARPPESAKNGDAPAAAAAAAAAEQPTGLIIHDED